MKTLVLIISLLGVNLLIYSQDKKSNSFVFYKGGKEYLKPIKYVLFNPEKDTKIVNQSDIFFHIKNERFKFSKKEHKKDTSNISSLEKIELSDAQNLFREEVDYREQKLKEDSSLKIDLPAPLTKLHQYFRVFIIVKNLDEIIIYEVDWEYSHSYK